MLAHGHHRVGASVHRELRRVGERSVGGLEGREPEGERLYERPFQHNCELRRTGEKKHAWRGGVGEWKGREREGRGEDGGGVCQGSLDASGV